MDENTATIRGFVDHIIYRNEENGYTVFLFFADNDFSDGEFEDGLTCTGTFAALSPGESIEISGRFTENITYGTQFNVESCEFVRPGTKAEIERYLSGGSIKGIGPTLAKKIVKKFGDDTFRIMENEPERLAEISGISMRMAQKFGIAMTENRGVRDACVFLQKFGITPRMALRIYDRYENRIYEIIRENPYRLSDEIEGIGFKTADRIASLSGLPFDSEERVSSCMLYLLHSAAGEGHTYLPYTILKRNLMHLINVPEEVFENVLTSLSIDRRIVVRGDGDKQKVYLEHYYKMEKRTASRLISMREMKTGDWEDNVKECMAVEQDNETELDEKQREAVCKAVSSGVFVLTGGPGTGKTTTLRIMIRLFERRGDMVLLSAPTGRAAKRMSEAAGRPAKTIHRLLEVKGAPDTESDKKGTSVRSRGGTFERNEENPLEADVVICDEASMIDLMLFDALVRAMPEGGTLVLVGDQNQLPSVGAGNVLTDILESKLFESVYLDTIFRQASQSDIVKNAHLINEGKPVTLDNKSSDFFFMERRDPQVLLETLVPLVNEKLPPYVSCLSSEIQVLCPMKKGSAGVFETNRYMQEKLNPPSPEKAEYIYGSRLFRVGDKVMQTKNDYKMPWIVKNERGVVVDSGEGIFNGDMGRIAAIYTEIREMKILFDDGKEANYPFSGLENLDLSYAVTIHKSQGSEYPAIVIVLLPGPRQLMNRNLLYTAVTRAKKCVVIIGRRDVFFSMEENDESSVRYSGFCEMLLSEGRRRA